MQGQRARSPMINRANFTDWLNEHYAKLQQDSLTKLPMYHLPWRVVADVHTPTCMRALPVHIHATGVHVHERLLQHTHSTRPLCTARVRSSLRRAAPTGCSRCRARAEARARLMQGRCLGSPKQLLRALHLLF